MNKYVKNFDLTLSLTKQTKPLVNEHINFIISGKEISDKLSFINFGDAVKIVQ